MSECIYQNSVIKKWSMMNSVILCLICAYDIANVGSIKVSEHNVDILLMKEFQHRPVLAN